MGGSTYKPLGPPQAIEELSQELLQKAERIVDPFEQSFFALVHLPYLQPFDDVNKRLSRLAANIPLLNRNYCPLTFLGVPERTYISGLLGIYEMNWVELLADVFIWACERSAREYLTIRQSLAPADPIRLRYSREIHALVGRLVREMPSDILGAIKAEAGRFPEEHRAAFLITSWRT